jgi:hypothetical protein
MTKDYYNDNGVHIQVNSFGFFIRYYLAEGVNIERHFRNENEVERVTGKKPPELSIQEMMKLC